VGVINQCKFLNIALGICVETNRACTHMADPLSCPNYDEDGKQFHHIPATQTNHLEPESLTEFVNRTESELNGLGIKVEKEEVEEAPDWF